MVCNNLGLFLVTSIFFYTYCRKRLVPGSFLGACMGGTVHLVVYRKMPAWQAFAPEFVSSLFRFRSNIRNARHLSL